MNKIIIIIFLLFYSTSLGNYAYAENIDLTENNPNTLIGTKSEDYTIKGIRLGLDHTQVWKLLNKSNLLIGEKDEFNPSRIFVYERKVNESKGKCLLYLTWEKGDKKLSHIAIFKDFQNYLSQNFRRLLNQEILNDESAFKKEFIGYASKSAVTLDVPQNDGRAKQLTYYYDKIGLEISHTKYTGNESISFALVNSKP